MARTQKKDIHGVSVVQTELQAGKWYTGVNDRVKIAEQADPAKVRREGAGYHVVSVQFVPIGDRIAYHCMVEYPVGSGVVTPGTDFIDTKDLSGVAKAETSAIGRALGLHGIAIEESIASAEEMAGVEGAEGSTDAPAATEKQWTSIRNGCRLLKRQVPRGPLTQAQAKDYLDQLADDYRAAREAEDAKAKQTAPSSNGQGVQGADLSKLPAGALPS